MATLTSRYLRIQALRPIQKIRHLLSLASIVARDTNRFHSHDHHHDNHHHGDHDESGQHKLLYAQHLKSRGLVEISGSESLQFIQGLVTNDVTQFQQTDEMTSQYAAMLNAQGRMLYDVILYRIDESTVWAECDSNAVQSFIKILKLHRLRKKIGIEDMTDEVKIWSIFNKTICPDHAEEPSFIDHKFNLAFVPDPRMNSFGWRLVLPDHTRMENTVRNAYEVLDSDSDFYTLYRYRLGVAEGMEELPTGKAFPLESNFDFLNGISFTKGCYVGQELTARTHHTGVTRKRLMPVEFLAPNIEIKNGAKVKNTEGKDVGRIRAVKDNYGLAMLRLGNLTSRKLSVAVEGGSCDVLVNVPHWWPLNDKELKKVGFSLTPNM